MAAHRKTRHTLPRPSGRGRVWVGLIGLAGLGAWALSWPAATRQGVDFHVSTYRIPLYAKALSFIDRDVQYRLLSRQMTHGLSSDQQRALALFTWTRSHIQPTPPGLPVVDDHVLHIIIRGYGEDDQMADVFTTLSTYAGMPAFWTQVKPDGNTGGLIVSFARIDGRWVLFDVANGLVFTRSDGSLADLGELLAHPELVRQTAGSLAPSGVQYERCVEQLQPFRVPRMLRARKQMPLPRLAFEIRRLFSLTSAAEAVPRSEEGPGGEELR